MILKKESCKSAIKNFYTKPELFSIYKEYILNWIGDGLIESDLNLFEISMITENENISTFIGLLDNFYSSKNSFAEIFKTLDEKVQNVFYETVWNDKFYLPSKNKEEYYSSKNNWEKIINDKYLFFKLTKDSKENEYLFLDASIAKKLRSFIKKPKSYYLIDAKPAKNLKKNSNEVEFLQHLDSYFDFFMQKGVSLSNSGKILKESKVNMKKYCDITEYYTDSKDLDYVKTEVISLFFFLVDDKYKNKDYFTSSNIKNIVSDFFDTKIIKDSNYIYSSLFLNYLKGVKNIWKHKEALQESLASIKEILGEVKKDMVVSVDNIIDALIYRDSFIDLINIQDVKDYIYINEANYERSKINTNEKYKFYIKIPFVKSVLFILNVLGILEIYYDLPSNQTDLYLKNGYLSKYDGIRYIKFTDLGNYVFGRTEKYEIKNDQIDFQIILDEERLIITLIGESPAKMMFLERIGQKIAANKYKITKESFLRGIESSHELKERIEEFHDKIEENPNGIWHDFFEELIHKSTVISSEPSYTVFKLTDDKELLLAISQDKRFKDLILKGEDYHVMVKNDDINLVIKLFKEHGYCINI